ncbi:extracellular solute-binding protein [Bacillus sp. SJS]|uniref:extracellular solute-binding protein n=1 Tax=Bacillus sp. SJS TaxID=1423321 RepID=UPI0004DD7E0E|nr:extracellular solute-binding protein [Bacillus sp. SJS]KZZ84974.1 ABC transporter substrate-binding protein [Bacillus sp. SJS]
MKKLAVLFAAAVMMFTMAACSNDQAATTESKKGTIKLVLKDEDPSNPATQKYFSNLEKALKKDEKLDVKFELVQMPQGNYAEKLNLLLYSGDIPDMIYFQGGDQQIADQDLLEDLTPYIEKSKNLKSIMEPYNEKRMKNYPYLLWIKPLDLKTPVIRSDWFNQLSSSKALMADPTPENYKAFFKELVEKAPGGGKPKNAITAAGDIAELDYIFNMAFGLNQTWLKKNDGTFEYAKVSEKEKAKLEFYSELYKEGLLDQQFATKQWDTKEKAFYDGDSGVIVGTNGKVIDIYNGKMTQVNGKEAELTVLPPAKGEFQGYGATDISKESRGIAISSQSKNKELAFKVLDYLASPKGQMLDRIGFENEHYKITDNQIELTDKYYSEWYARFWEPADFKPEKTLKTPLLSKPAEESAKLVQQYYSEDNKVILDEASSAKWDAAENLYKEFSADVITGKRPISDFDQFAEEWKKAGGDEITKFVNGKLK